MRTIRDIYISGSLFTPAERAYLERVDELCRGLGLSTYLPHRDAGFGLARGKSVSRFFRKDLAMLRRSRALVAVLNGADADAGTAWEVGFAFALGKKVIALREDIRIAELNVMLAGSTHLVKSFRALKKGLADRARITRGASRPKSTRAQ